MQKRKLGNSNLEVLTLSSGLLSAASVGGARSQSISLLFVDSKLWAKFGPGLQGYDVQAHAAGPSPGDVVIITSERILAAVLDGAMPAQTALDLGLIAVDGKRDDAEAIRRVISAATDRTHMSGVAGVPAIPIRFFGPAR